jgi:RNA polymerase sigma-70 factor (family 1)
MSRRARSRTRNDIRVERRAPRGAWATTDTAETVYASCVTICVACGGDRTGDIGVVEPDDGGARVRDELQLAARVRGGDADALAVLYARYRAALLALAEGYVGEPEDAADVVQDVFVNVWRRRARWVIERSVAAYFYIAVRNTAMKVSARVRRAEEFVPALHEASAFNSGENRLVAPELERVVERVVNGLPERCRLIYRMHRDGRCSYADIGAALGISPQTVRVQLIKAWDLLDERLAAAGWSNVLRRQG